MIKVYFTLFILVLSFLLNEFRKTKTSFAIHIQMRYDFLDGLSHRFSANGFNRLIYDL